MNTGTIGPYRLLARIGDMPLGEIHAAESSDPKRRVALALLSPEAARDAERTAWFCHEIRAASTLEHPNICAFQLWERDDGAPCAVMDLLEGQTLSELLTGGPRPFAQLLDIAVKTARALAFAHEHGVTHGTLRPSRIVIGDAGRVRVQGFGLGAPPRRTSAGEPTGSPATEIPTPPEAHYAAPEQLRGEPAHAPADVFALGAILHEMATGEPHAPKGSLDELATFLDTEAPRHADLRADCPPAIGPLLVRCLARLPRERPASRELLEEIEALGADRLGRVLYANTPARDLLAEGKPLQGLALADVLEHCPSELREAASSGGDALFSLQRGEETETWHLSRRSFRLDMRPHVIYMLERLTPQLRRQEVAVWKKVIRVIGHELNNSLAPIASLVRSARKIAAQPAPEERLGEVLDVIEERAEHLRQFLAGYATLARLPQPRREDVDLAEFFANLQRLWPHATEGPVPTGTASFDPSQVQQALINLLKNAREAGSPTEDTAIAVSLSRAGRLTVYVRDRGCGMDDETLEHALLPFYSSKEPASGLGGVGLGLTLCREILEGHGGTLRLQRRPEGGLTVTCTLPPSGTTA